MRLNNKSIPGMYKYDPSLEFEAGDFVVVGDLIYVCKAENPNGKEHNTVSGIMPGTDQYNYQLYLASKLATSYEDFSDFLQDPTSEKDTLVTGTLLSQVINRISLGYNDKGIISDYILCDASDNTQMTYSENLKEIIEDNTRKNLRVLDKILHAKDFNHAVLKISRNAEGVDLLMGSEGNAGNDFVILKQYSYIDNKDYLVRVQELVDLDSSRIYFRYARFANAVVDSSVTAYSWRTYSEKYQDYKVQIEYALNKVLAKEQELENTKINLTSQYCYSRVPLNFEDPTVKSKIEIEAGITPADNTAVIRDFLSTPVPFDILVTKGNTGFKTSSSITIDFSTVDLDDNGQPMETFYFLPDLNSYLSVYNTGSKVIIKVVGKPEVAAQPDPGATIVSIFYKKSLNNGN